MRGAGLHVVCLLNQAPRGCTPHVVDTDDHPATLIEPGEQEAP